MAVTLEVTVFWNMMACSLAESYQCSEEGTSHSSGGRVKAVCEMAVNFPQAAHHHIPETDNLQQISHVPSDMDMQSNPVITTLVYATPCLQCQIFCGTN
jgi:hypothetical protein